MRLALFCCCALVGCSKILPLPGANLADANGDHPAGQDLPTTFDQSPDQPGITFDRSPDQPGLPDVAIPPDLASPDSAPPPPDSAPLDKAPLDKAPPPPCSSVAVERPATAVWTNMIPCESKNTTAQQGAAAACNSGWHLCTTTEYLSRGGKVKMLTSQYPIYWIAGCVEPGKAPTEAVCPSFPAGCSGGCEVGWGCSGPPGISRSTHAVYPLSAHVSCYRVGVNSSTYGAFWFTLTPGGSPPTTGAVCCRDP